MLTSRFAAVRFISLVIVLLGLAGIVFDAARVVAADEPDADVAARRKWQTQLTSRKSTDRLEAIQQLRNFPNVEVAKLIVSRGLNDREEDVRKAAESALTAMKDNPGACEYFVELLTKEARRKGDPAPALYPVFRVLLASSVPAASGAALGYLDKSSTAAPEATAALASYVDELGQKAAPGDLVQLDRIAKSKVFEREFGVQRAVVRAAMNIKTKEAVVFMISLLEKQKGELRADILGYLEQNTGEQYGADAPAYRKWWREHEATFEFPKAQAAVAPKVDAGGEGGSYYGIPLYAKRMVFVIDISNSMHGDKIVAAKRDLIKTVNELDKDRYFGLVGFNRDTFVWQKNLVAATDSNKRDAEYWVEEQQLASGTASYDALEAAMQFDAEAIYFLTDGAPAGGKITEPNAIVAAITQLNRVRRESIYSIGVGVSRGGKKAKGAGGKHGGFLQSLSSQNYGIYRAVEE